MPQVNVADPPPPARSMKAVAPATKVFGIGDREIDRAAGGFGADAGVDGEERQGRDGGTVITDERAGEHTAMLGSSNA